MTTKESQMARTKQDPIMTFDDEVTGVRYELLEPKELYLLTYDNKLVSLRNLQFGGKYKYPKSSWTVLGSAKANVKRLNRNFNTHLFGYIKMTDVV